MGENLCRGLYGRKGNLVNLYHLFHTFLMQKVLFIFILASAMKMLSTFSQRHLPKQQLPNGSSPCEISQVATSQVCHSRRAPAPLHSTVFQIAFNTIRKFTLGKSYVWKVALGKRPL